MPSTYHSRMQGVVLFLLVGAEGMRDQAEIKQGSILPCSSTCRARPSVKMPDLACKLTWAHMRMRIRQEGAALLSQASDAPTSLQSITFTKELATNAIWPQSAVPA